MKIFNEILASLLLFACGVALVYTCMFVLPVRQAKTVVHRYEYVLRVDSAGSPTDEARAQADSLIRAVKHHEREIDEQYNYVLRQREDTQNWYAMGGLIISIILAVCGFFGYKNFKSIEEKAVSAAESKAEGCIKERIDIAENNLRHQNAVAIDNEMTEKFTNFKRNDMENAIAVRLKDEYNQKVDERLSEIEAMQQKLEGLDSEISRLNKLMDSEIPRARKLVPASTKKGMPASQQEIENAEMDVVSIINNHGKKTASKK